jgi:arylsulfatase A-like enzyme
MRAGTGEPPTKATGPNVLLLVLDTVRAWDIGWMGYYRPTTPKLARWVGEGATFNRVLSTSPWTAPSHGSIFTGHLPTEISINWDTPLDDRQPTLAEVLRRRLRHRRIRGQLPLRRQRVGPQPRLRPL